jgi:hypothetical protein
MVISLEKLVNQTNACVVMATQNSRQGAQLAGVYCSLNKTVYSVPTLGDLPSASENKGRFIFVQSTSSYRYSDGITWTNNFDTTLTTTSTGLIFSWGGSYNGTYGSLGDNSTAPRSSPVREITSSTTWRLVAAGAVSTHAIKTDGSLWSWGCNSYGRLGDNTSTDRSSPVMEITSSTNWCQISGGVTHASAIKTDGSLWSWGQNYFGRLGNNSTINRSSPVREITSSTNWCQASAGGSHTNALKTDGSLWSWGSASGGVLGNNSTIDRSSPVREITSSTNWCQVGSGLFHVSAVKTDGSLWSWGCNNYGNLGNNSTINRSSPVREITSSTNWCQVGSGSVHVSAVKTDGSLWSWGCNNYGNLGNNSTINRSSPVREITSSTNWCQVSAGSFRTGALKTDGSLWSWGYNNRGGLGNNSTISRSSPVREITSNTDWCLLDAGNGHTAAIRGTSITKGFNAVS